MDLNEIEGSDGRRSGGPNVASGEDTSQSCDDSSQHSGGSGSLSIISKETEGQFHISEEGACGGQDDDSSDLQLELNFDSGESDSGWMDEAMRIMKELDNGGELDDEQMKRVQEICRGPRPSQEIARPIAGFKIEGGRIEELDSWYKSDPLTIPHTRFFDKSVFEWSNVAYIPLPTTDDVETGEHVTPAPSQSTWAYSAPESPSGHSPPPSPWVLPQQATDLPFSAAVQSDWTCPLNSPISASPRLSTASPIPQFYASTGQDSLMVSSSLHQSSTFTDQPSSNVSANLPPPSFYTGQPLSYASQRPPQFSISIGQPYSNVSASLSPASFYTGQPLSYASASPPQFSTFVDKPTSTARPQPATSGATAQLQSGTSGATASKVRPQPATSGATAQLQPGTSAATASKVRPQPATSRVPQGIGMSYLYASKASRIKNVKDRDDESIVSSILTDCFPNDQAEAKEASQQPPEDYFTRLLKARVSSHEELIRTQEEWNEITSQVQERRLDQKSLKEAMVDFETLLQLYLLSASMTSYFRVPPSSIREAFEMAYTVKKVGKPEKPYEPTRKELSSLAKRLSMELLGIIPGYDDFPIPYMAGMDVPESWFYLRFKNISAFDRLRRCKRGPDVWWYVSTRYSLRKQLRFCFVRPEPISQDYPYDRTRKPAKNDVILWKFLEDCAGPPFEPVPSKDTFKFMNHAALNNYLIRFEKFLPKIVAMQRQQKTQMEQLFKSLELITKRFGLFNRRYEDVRTRYHKKAKFQDRWNLYIRELSTMIFALLQRIIDIAQKGMLQSIKYSDSWIFKNKDIELMLKHRIPLFDPKIVDERPQPELLIPREK